MRLNLMRAYTWLDFSMKARQDLKSFRYDISDGNIVNGMLLTKLITDGRETEFGKSHDFRNIHDADDMRRKLPLSTYEDYSDFVTRLYEKGQLKINMSYGIMHFFRSGENGDIYPISTPDMKPYERRSLTRFMALARERYKKEKGTAMPAGSIYTTIDFYGPRNQFGIPEGKLSPSLAYPFQGFFAGCGTSPAALLFADAPAKSPYAGLLYALREESVTLMAGLDTEELLAAMRYLEEHWAPLVRDIREGTIREEALPDPALKKTLPKKLKPMPERADSLEKIFSEGFDTPVLPQIWPKLYAISAIQSGNTEDYGALRRYSGEILLDCSLYCWNGQALGVAPELGKDEYLILPGVSYYEFIPADDGEEMPVTRTYKELEAGKNYEIVITNRSGFYRLRTGEIIHITGYTEKLPRFTRGRA